MKHGLATYCVGLTGGVGCGKSTAAKLFAALGAAVVDTDAIAHALTAPAGAALPAIAATFGQEVIAPDASLDRAAMRRLVFADVAARRTLERILHPLIRDQALHQVAAASTAAYVLLIVPLLLENLAAYRQTLARIAVVDCDEGQQIARTTSRPGVSHEQARAILAAQSPRAARLAIADDLIENRGSLAELEARVGQLHTFYLGHPGNN